MNNLKNKIGIGTLQFGFDYGIANKTGKLKTKEIIEIKKIAQKNHISIVDTAHAYGDCEKRLGKINFNKFDIVTKLPATKPDSNAYKWATSSIQKA